TTHHPVVVRIHEIRKSDREDSYKKKRFWLLRDLKVVDGINPRKLPRLLKVVPEFELTTDKVYKYLVTNPSEKDPFIKQVWKLCNRYLPAQKPDFINISLPVEELEYANVSMTTSVADGISHQEPEPDDYQPISAKEEEDFRHLLQKCNMSIGQAERFFDHLTRELSVLDSANIQTIMGSEMHLAELMNKIDSALEEANSLEETLDSYDELLLHVREGVEMMEEKDSLLHIHTSNRQRLIAELNQFLNSTSLSSADVQALNECNLMDPVKINRCTQAALSLQSCLNAKVAPGTIKKACYERLKAYTDQMKVYEDLRDSFAERFVAHLTALMRNLTSDDAEYETQTSGSLLSHDSTIYLPLKPFHDLVSWLKNVLPGGYKMLLDRYVTFCKSMYHKEIGAFFDIIKQQVKPGPLERKPSGLKNSDSTDFIKSSPKPSPSGSLSADNRSKLENQSNAIDRVQFKRLIDQIFNELEPIVQSEQKFCVWFFHVVYDLKTDQLLATDNQSELEQRKFFRSINGCLKRLFFDQVRSILSQLFGDLDVQLQEFVSFCDRINP
uniref:Exocyst complex component Sec3 PIP2-binding N-terminal domain-containing protein n=1 Tax=Romanomermis culicivorax TaxID=13658 RepID=A0A915L501_ROMCU